MTAATTRNAARHKAALIHLIASIIIVGAVLAVPFGLWYPGELRPLSGFNRHLIVLFAAVLVVGPALTWLVYRTGKRGLLMNMIVVILIQVVFLAYASAMVARLRPVFLVATPDQYTLVFANEIRPDDLAAASRPEWRRLPWTGPALVGVRMPEDAAGRREVMEAFMSGGAGIERTPRFYVDFGEVAPLEPGVVPVVSTRGTGSMRIKGLEGHPHRSPSKDDAPSHSP